MKGEQYVNTTLASAKMHIYGHHEAFMTEICGVGKTRNNLFSQVIS